MLWATASGLDIRLVRDQRGGTAHLPVGPNVLGSHSTHLQFLSLPHTEPSSQQTLPCPRPLCSLSSQSPFLLVRGAPSWLHPLWAARLHGCIFHGRPSWGGHHLIGCSALSSYLSLEQERRASVCWEFFYYCFNFVSCYWPLQVL